MKELRLFKLNKYDEFNIDETTIKDKIKLSFENPNEYIFGIDLTREANVFYGLNSENLFEQIQTSNNFNNYDIVCRLLNWSKNKEKESYGFRILKTNKNQEVDFKEELEYLKCKII